MPDIVTTAVREAAETEMATTYASIKLLTTDYNAQVQNLNDRVAKTRYLSSLIKVAEEIAKAGETWTPAIHINFRSDKTAILTTGSGSNEITIDISSSFNESRNRVKNIVFNAIDIAMRELGLTTKLPHVAEDVEESIKKRKILTQTPLVSETTNGSDTIGGIAHNPGDGI